MQRTSKPEVFFNQVSSVEPVPVGAFKPIDFHERLPGYRPTELISVPNLATRLGIKAVLVKNESERLGLPAFKMLGASWASYRAIIEHTGIDPEGWGELGELVALIEPHLPLRLATATDGNHGRAVARIAKMLGLSASIWVPHDMVSARIEAIESEGAEVTVDPGTYDDAVAAAARNADSQTLVISDTSWPGYEVVPQWVIDGYTTMMTEIDQQLQESDLPHPTVVPAPMGVGALAAAVISHFGVLQPRPIVIGGEPTNAACVMAALRANEIVTLPGPHPTIMAGLSCGTASPIAFPMVKAGMTAVVSFEDEWAREAMRLLADEGIVAGETGAASLATLLAIVDAVPEVSGRLHLGPDDVALLIVTEGATDPGNYERVVGRSASAVAGRDTRKEQTT